MKNLKQSAIALMVVGVSASPFAFGNSPKDIAVQDVELVDVKAVINQLIEITPQSNVIEFKDEFDIDKWERVMPFEVRRQGAHSERAMPYKLTVSGDKGAEGSHFILEGEDGLNANMLMYAGYKYLTHTDGGGFGKLTPGTATNQTLYTSSGIGMENIDHNLYLYLTIPKEEVASALVGNYGTTLTVMVAAE